MLCRHTLELHKDAAPLPSLLISREMLADSAQIDNLLARAQARADALLVQAQAQHAALLERAWLDFWNRANAQLARWEAERLAMCDQLEHIAAAVTNQALRNLLEEMPSQERVNALLRQLLATQVPAVQATLLCNPLDRETVEQWLNIHTDAPWCLRPEDNLAPHTLLLETDEGGIRVDWTSALESLLIAEAAHSKK